MTQIKMLHVGPVLLALATLVCYSFAQTPCQKANCPNNTYCDEKANGSTECIQCDVSCISCNGPGPEMCGQCKIGYVKPQGTVQPCMPCVDGFFGVNCSSNCHCLNNKLCNKTNGLCLGWKCDRGYTGLPFCQELCPVGTFGLDCQFLCHCPDNDNCSNVNGDCSSGLCHPDWTSAGCLRRLPKLALPPTLLEARCGNITIQWDAFNETRDIGTGPVGQYNVYMMPNNTFNESVESWQPVGNVSQQPSSFRYTSSATAGLVPDQEYNFRVDVVGVEYNKLLSRITMGTKSDMMMNPCLTTTTLEPENTTKIAISRKVFDHINVTAWNSSFVIVSWVVLPEFKDYEYNVTLTQQLLGNGDCDDEGGAPEVIGPLQISSTPYEFGNLLSWSTYMISVSAVALTAELRETISQNVTTLASTPNGTITALKWDDITSTEAVLSWGPVPCDQRKGPLSSYDLQLTSVGDSGAAQIDYVTQEERFRLVNLTSYTNYSVQIRYKNVAGAGPWSEEYNFTTLEGVPGSVEISELIPTYSTITVIFVPPTETSGIITTYTTMFASNSNNFDLSQAFTVMAANGRTNMTIDRLSPETLYFLKMAASTSAGIGQYGSVKPTRTLKAPLPLDPMIIKLLSRTNSCLTLEWIPPADNGTISSFVIEVRKVTADVSTPPIRADDIAISQHSYEVCQLKPSTLYIVTISGVSIDGVVTSARDNFITEHGTPPNPIAPVFVRSTYTNITIAIEPVVSLDVPITAYEIQVYLVPANGRRKRFAGVPGYVTAKLAPTDVTSRRDFVVGDGQTYGTYINKVLERESYYMIYYIAISVLNNDTTASWSQLKAAVQTVPFDPALAPPLTFSVASKNMTCLTVTWALPHEVENSTTGFMLTLKRTNDDTSPVIMKELPATTWSYQECNLIPYTPYTFGISAKKVDGVLATASETFITEHNTPRKPAAPLFVNATFTEITVSIEPVILTDAPLTAYQLQVEEASSSRRRRVAGVPGYVTAQLTQDNVTQKMYFVVGDGLEYGGYINQPLKRETFYTLHYVVISTASGITKYSYSSLTPPVRTVPFVGAPDNKDVYIGVIVALVLFILLIILLIFLYCWWKRRYRFNPYEIQDNDKNAVPLPKFENEYEPENYWSAIYNLKESRHIIAGRHLVYKEDQDPHIGKESSSHVNLPKVSFRDEFHNLPHKVRRASNNLAQRNKDLNRFPHLLPYDHSLVKLKPSVSSRRTYINASFIPGYKKGPTYIAAQSPYDEKTIIDFWRLIVQKSIKTVVMVTNAMKDSFVTCVRYWPENTKESIGNFDLDLIEVNEFADFIVRTVVVRSSEEEHSKTVKLFQFTSWPAHGVPEDPIPFLEMRYKVRQYHNDEPGPILVHCGTGMGKTGVFIAVDALIEQYATEGRVMVFDYVKRMRRERPYMVRTEKQYLFIYEAVFEEFHAGDTLVDFDLKDRYHDWIQKNPLTGHTYLKDQHQLMEAFSRRPSKEECKTALQEINIQKNRYPDILPSEKNRPLLKSQGGLNPTDYINAVFLDSHFKKNHFIITQTPLHTTIIDFWKLVYDYDVHTIVMVEDFTKEDNTCAEYWPSMNLKLFEPFFIETTATYHEQYENVHEGITIRNFSIRSTQYPKKPAKLVRQFQFSAWAQSNLTPPSREMLLSLIDGIFAWQDESCQDERPIIVHCQNGASHSGLFAILAILCEKLEEEGEIDVYRTIKHCKSRRTQFISDYEQFRFCYKTVWDFINLHMPGGTFSDTFKMSKSDQTFGVASLSSFGGTSDEDTTQI